MKKLLTACCMLTGCMLCLHGHAQSVNIPSDSLPSSDKKWPSDVVAVAFGPKSSYHGHLLVKKVPPTYHGHLLVKKPDDKKRHLRVVPAPGIEDKPDDKSRIPLSNVGFAGDKGDKGCLSLSYSMIVNKNNKNGKTKKKQNRKTD